MPKCYYNCENPPNLRCFYCKCGKSLMTCNDCYDCHEWDNNVPNTTKECICKHNECLELLGHEKCPDCHIGYLLYTNKYIKTCNTTCDYTECDCGIGYFYNDWYIQDLGTGVTSHKDCSIKSLEKKRRIRKGISVCVASDDCECKKCTIFCFSCNKLKRKIDSRSSITVTGCDCVTYCNDCKEVKENCGICGREPLKKDFVDDCDICCDEGVSVNNSSERYIDCKCILKLCKTCCSKIPKCSFCKNLSFRELRHGDKNRCCSGFVAVGYRCGQYYCSKSDCQCHTLINNSIIATEELVDRLRNN